MNVLWLLSNGAGREEAAKYGEVSLSSAKNYIRAEDCGGLEEVERLGYKGSCGKLAPFHDKIKESFEDVPPRTCN
jgi:transposase